MSETESLRAWDRLLDRFFESHDRLAVQWAIGAIIAGGPRKVLVINGPSGSGKSTILGLAEDILRHCVEEDSLPFMARDFTRGMQIPLDDPFLLLADTRLVTYTNSPLAGRIIQVQTTGYQFDAETFDQLGQAVHDNRGPIGSRCLKVYRKLGPNHYDNQENHK